MMGLRIIENYYECYFGAFCERRQGPGQTSIYKPGVAAAQWAREGAPSPCAAAGMCMCICMLAAYARSRKQATKYVGVCGAQREEEWRGTEQAIQPREGSIPSRLNPRQRRVG